MAILLADMHDFSYKEIADVLDCPVGTVMSRLHRARKMLQSNLMTYAIERGVVTAPQGNESENVTDLDSFRRQRGNHRNTLVRRSDSISVRMWMVSLTNAMRLSSRNT